MGLLVANAESLRRAVIAACTVAAVIVAPLSVGSCSCSVAAASPRSCPCAQKSCCCCEGCGAPSSADSCCEHETPTNTPRPCSCSLSDEDALAVLGTSQTSLVEEGRDVSLAVAVPPGTDSGLNGRCWITAFDLTSPEAPPGIRLHALLRVWQI